MQKPKVMVIAHARQSKNPLLQIDREPSGVFCLKAPLSPNRPESRQIGLAHIHPDMDLDAGAQKWVVAKVRGSRWASNKDVWKEAHALGIAPDAFDSSVRTADVVDWLKKHKELIDRLQARRFDGAFCSNENEVKNTRDPQQSVVVFQESQVEPVLGIQRTIWLQKMQVFRVASPAKWERQHTRLEEKLSSPEWGWMEPGKERLEKLLKLEREINHLHASYSKAEFNLNAINPANGNGILLAACQQADVLSLVLGKGVNPLARDEILNTALHHSTDPQAVPILVRAGLSVNAVNSSGNTPLHQHAEGGNADVVKALIRAGADVNARNTLGKTPLHLIHRSFADESSSLKIADLLLDAGADPNAADDNGKTPLHDAVGVNANFDVPIALRLIDRGASIDAEDECGLRPLHFAVVRESNLIKHLLALGASSHGVIGHKHWIESDLREKSRFRTALRIEDDQSLRIFAECLRKNPDVREEDLQFASELFKRKKTFFKQHSAMLASHMAKKAVDACLSSNERALHTSPSP